MNSICVQANSPNLFTLLNCLKKSYSEKTHGFKLLEENMGLVAQTKAYKVLIRKSLATAYKELRWSKNLEETTSE